MVWRARPLQRERDAAILIARAVSGAEFPLPVPSRPADLLGHRDGEPDPRVVRAGYNRHGASRTGAPRVPKYCNEPNSVSNKTDRSRNGTENLYGRTRAGHLKGQQARRRNNCGLCAELFAPVTKPGIVGFLRECMLMHAWIEEIAPPFLEMPVAVITEDQ